MIAPSPDFRQAAADPQSMPAETIQFRDLARQALRNLPQAPRAARATARALLLKKDKRRSIGALVAEAAAAHPTRTALRYRDQSYSYSQFNQRANRVAHALAARGVGRGDAVAILMENRPEVLFAVSGIVKLGAVASMLNTSQRGEVLQHSLQLIEAKAVIVGTELLPALQELDEPAAQTWLVQREAPDEQIAGNLNDFDAELATQATHDPAITAQITLGEPAYYIFTSGTTGLPKASVMSHLRWMRACYAMGQASLGMSEDDVFYCCLPLYHNNALTLAWSAALGAGATLALARKFSASRFWDDIRQFDATVFCYIGELCRYLLAQPPGPGDTNHSIRACMGNGLRPDIWDEFKQRFGIERINEFYGASEGNLVFTNAFNQDRTAGYCPMSFAIVAYDMERDEPVRDRKGRMCKVGKGEAGLLLTEVTERFNFEGYTDSAASEKKLYRDVFKRGDCWFDTGDLVRDQGFKHIQFVDRLGDTFRWKGENVATTEVEAAVNAWPQVEQSVVYGVAVPGTDGRAGMACVTPHCAHADFDFAGFADHLRAQLPAYAVPLFLRLHAAPEITGTFKYRKVDLKEQGFDPAACGEPVWCLGRDGYAELGAADVARIEAGKGRW